MELCRFLGGGWKVIYSFQQLSQPLFTVHNKGGGLILSKKKTSQLKWKGPKKGKKAFLYKLEILH
jgi:hypothetical protein